MKKAIAAVKTKLKPQYKIEDEAHYYAGKALGNRQMHVGYDGMVYEEKDVDKEKKFEKPVLHVPPILLIHEMIHVDYLKGATFNIGLTQLQRKVNAILSETDRERVVWLIHAGINPYAKGEKEKGVEVISKENWKGEYPMDGKFECLPLDTDLPDAGLELNLKVSDIFDENMVAREERIQDPAAISVNNNFTVPLNHPANKANKGNKTTKDSNEIKENKENENNTNTAKNTNNNKE